MITELAEAKALQLLGLLCSMLKAAGNRRVMQLLDNAVLALSMQELGRSECHTLTEPNAWHYADVALGVAGRVLKGVLRKHSDTGQLDAARTLSVLPWLALIGRGIMFCGAELQATIATG
jgi:hypothetical protein